MLLHRVQRLCGKARAFREKLIRVLRITDTHFTLPNICPTFFSGFLKDVLFFRNDPTENTPHMHQMSRAVRATASEDETGEILTSELFWPFSRVPADGCRFIFYAECGEQHQCRRLASPERRAARQGCAAET